jgi:hypothetical protein
MQTISTINKIDNLISTATYQIEIRSNTEVLVDSYEHGELETCNSWVNDTKRIILAKEDLSDTLKEAIKQYIKEELYADFCINTLKETLANDDDQEYFYWNELVDVDNMQPTENQIKRWRQNKEELFNQSISISITINGTPITADILYELLFKEIKGITNETN